MLKSGEYFYYMQGQIDNNGEPYCDFLLLLLKVHVFFICYAFFQLIFSLSMWKFLSKVQSQGVAYKKSV